MNRPVAALIGLLAPLTGCSIESGGTLLHVPDGTTQVDTDGDGIPDDSDVCPDQPDRMQADFDGDGVGNACDPDAIGTDGDGDGVDDALDQCHGSVSGTNEDRDEYPGTPGQIVDDCDNCPTVANPDQANGDRDDIGDACEPPGCADLLGNRLFFDRLREDETGWRLLDRPRWNFQSGALIASPSNVLCGLLPDGVSGALASRYALETEMEFSPTTDDPFWGGLLVSSVPDASMTRLESWYACVLHVMPATGEMTLALRRLEPGCTEEACAGGITTREEPCSDTWIPEGSYRLQVLRDGNRITCWLAPHSGDVRAQVSLTVTSLEPGPPGVVAHGADVSFLRAAVWGP